MKPLLFGLLLAPLAAIAAEPSVKLAGLQVVWNDGDKQFGFFKTYNMEEGISVCLIASLPDKQIVGIEEDDAKLQIGGATAKARFYNGDSALSKDRHSLRLEFTAPGSFRTEADGKIKITGGIPVKVATGSEETKSSPLALKAGSKVAFPAEKTGLPTLSVHSVEKKNDETRVNFSTDRKRDELKGVKFYDKEGKEIESDFYSSSWSSFGGKGSGVMTFSFKTAPEELVIGLETWTGSETVNVKVDFAAGLAAAKP